MSEPAELLALDTGGFLRTDYFTKYNPETGDIMVSGIQSAFITDQLRAQGQPFLRAQSTRDDYVDLDTLTVKTKAPFPGALEGLSLTNLPVPCTLTIDATVYTVEDGTAELSFDAPGTYQIVVSSTRYKSASFTVSYEDSTPD